MATATEILAWVKDVFDQKELGYELLEDKNTLKIHLPLKSKLKNFTAYFNCRERSYTVNAYIPLGVDEDSRQKIAEYITRANYGLRFGNFELDFSDGEIRYRLTVDCANYGLRFGNFELDFSDGEIRYRLTVDCEDRSSLSESLVMRSIFIPMTMFDRYGDGLVAVMFGIKSPEEAINDAEKD